MARKCSSPGCAFSLPDNYPLDKCPWHMAPGSGPVKIAAALAVAAAGFGGGLAYKKFKAYLDKKQLRKERKAHLASAKRPLPNRRRKFLLFVMDLLQSLGNSRANAKQPPRRNRSQPPEIVNHSRAAAVS